MLKDSIKKIGRAGVLLSSFSLKDMPNAKKILVVWLTHEDHVKRIAASIKGMLPDAAIFILTSEANREFVEREMQNCELILPAVNTRRFRYARQLYRFRKEGFDCILLTKLDVSVLFITLACHKAQVLLNNIWNEWYAVRLRRLSELFMLSDDTRRQLSIRAAKKAGFPILANFFKFCFMAAAYSYLFLKVACISIRNIIKAPFRFKIKEGL